MDIEKLTKLAEQGMTDVQIARECDMDMDMWHACLENDERAAKALEMGRELLNASVEDALLKEISKGRISAIIFWLRARMPERWGVRQARSETDASAAQKWRQGVFAGCGRDEDG